MNVAPLTSPFQPKKPRRLSFNAFIKRYGEGTPGFKYEWNNGIIEKQTAMKQNELYIIRNLSRCFLLTKASFEGGYLTSEVEVWTSESQYRKPDMAFFTDDQIKSSSKNQNNIPSFVIEVISTFDPINIVNNKVLEYFKAGVQTLWHIFPEQKMVYIFTSIKNIKVCEGDDVCSAAPALPDFQITVNDIFK